MQLQSFLKTLDVAYLDEVVGKFGLYSSWPVNLEPVFDKLNVRCYFDQRLPAGYRAFVARRKDLKLGVACFDRSLRAQELRQVIGHELGHLLLHEAGRTHYCAASGPGRQLQLSRDEQEADFVSAYLLIPGPAVVELFAAGLSADQVAGTLGVTREMLDLRVQVMVVRGELRR